VNESKCRENLETSPEEGKTERIAERSPYITEKTENRGVGLTPVRREKRRGKIGL